MNTVLDLLENGQDDAIAISAPNRSPLTFAELRIHVASTVHSLNTFGIGRNDAVAIVLSNGPEMASAFLSISAGATTAPLNPAYQQKEFEFYLSDLNAKLLVVEEGDKSLSRKVANKLGIGIAELHSNKKEPAGLFQLKGKPVSNTNSKKGFAQEDDIAIVLHTSGTTSRPKIVPLSHKNICTSAKNIMNSLDLVPQDICLNIMPLFHIHGLMAAVLSSLSSGASVFCTPGFNALKFFAWLVDSNATWYTGVPTMHQAILNRAARNSDVIKNSRLRFLRSSSASLPPRVMVALEKTFNVPVIESYGMTEAAHQMSSNPLPPRERKAGSVGIAAGPEISIIDESGTHLPPGSIGEVVIRGQNVTLGYQNNPKANASAFTNGWFRTGDQGVIDEEDYLRLTGRLKEIINRGGEKISPREIDEILLDHPAVAQAVTFAMPHEKLGEDVAVALVLKEENSTTEREIREFAGQRLADFKVPRKVIFLEEIPKGPTGKMQRIGLAEKLGIN